jgi:hypothetical protein
MWSEGRREGCGLASSSRVEANNKGSKCTPSPGHFYLSIPFSHTYLKRKWACKSTWVCMVWRVSEWREREREMVRLKKKRERKREGKN